MNPDRFTASSVRAHYEGLAPVYASRANRACQRAYRALIQRHLGQASRVLELGAGAAECLAGLPATLKIATNLTPQMLRKNPGLSNVIADASALPLQPASVDAVFSINLLEHVPEPARVIDEAARVMRPGGIFLAITPNGDMEALLNVLETFGAKLPEGPHRFLRMRELEGLVQAKFTILEHRGFLALPFGAPRIVQIADRCLLWSLFQYFVAIK